ncbi:MAG: glutamine--fructose-6-phosphate transaminase (isomerizing) [Oscillospiraceae bacterium]|nr:glutamine--fructose-6-phosphate transaminase (isomerizing) [Oscillospiraceae bacterium]
MCGIIGYAGVEKAVPLLLDGLESLEYRGYDSAGLALFTPAAELLTLRAAGPLTALRKKAWDSGKLEGGVGIGHTRWATHGEPSEANAHPHRSAGGKYTVVHNGIIENYETLRRELEEEGLAFSSQTDTEVIAQLLERVDTGDPLETLRLALPRLEGSYALGILYEREPDCIYCARKQSPLLAAVTESGTLLASDAAALLPYTRTVFRFEDGEMACLRKNGLRFFDSDGNDLDKTPAELARHVTAADKSGYAHFMRKEIDEQPVTVRRTLEPLLPHGAVELGAAEELLAREEIRHVLFLGCGSAYHVGAVGRLLVEELAGIPAAVDLASEFRGQAALVDPRTLVVIISQSGETADTLQALRLAKEKGARTLSVVNVEGSSIAIESDSVIYTKAGLEVAVATTKAYSTQLAVVYALAARLSECRSGNEPRDFLHALAALPDLMEEVLRASEAPALAWAEEIYTAEHAFFIGRNLDYAAAMEASLKLKEISYIHAEAYAAGELKHGTISLIERGTPVISLCCRPEVVARTKGSMEEVAARGAKLFCVTTDASFRPERRILLPKCHPLLVASLAALPMQLFAYHCAQLRGCAIDKPRNLAKSVTVE